MNLKELYQIAEENEIEVYSAHCPRSTAISLKCGEKCFVGLDTGVYKSEARERQALAHELAHCTTDSFYSDYQNEINIKRMEHRALKREIEYLLPRNELAAALDESATLWSIAEQFDVPPALVKRAMWIYFQKEVG